MSKQGNQLEQVGKHEVQYAVVTLSRDKEFIKLMECEMPFFEESLASKLGSQNLVVKHSLYKSMDKYFLSIQVEMNYKKIDFRVLINDSGPAFIIEAGQQEYSLLSAKRVRETLFDFTVSSFDIQTN